MKYLFGPVPSRRLGISLGIDLLVDKICSMDCIYCEVSRTKLKTMERDEYVPTNEVIDEIKDYLNKNFSKDKPNAGIDFITFSGSGEPTLHSKLGYIIDEIKKITDIPVAVLTNSTTLGNQEIFDELLKADLVVPSLDAVSYDIMDKINKPADNLTPEQIIENIKKLVDIHSGEVWLEILICDGVNDSDDEFFKLKEAVDYINPKVVQINTVARPSLGGNGKPAKKERIEKLIELIGEKARVVNKFSKTREFGESINEEYLIKSLLRIRSCRLDEVEQATGIKKEHLNNIINEMIDKKIVRTTIFDGTEYFKIV